MTEAGSGVGWRRRDRTSDVGAAALITLGGLVAKYAGVVPGGRVLSWLFVAAGLALALLYRDRWLERTDGEVWLGSAWWWLRPWGARRVRLRPARVVVEPGGTGWWARRRTVLSIANDVDASAPAPGGPRPVEVLERWTEPTCQEYAQSVAASLARWLGVSTGGVLAPFEPLSPEVARARLRASLADLKSAHRFRPRRARARVSGDTHVIEARRRWFEVFWRVWVVALGATLSSLWRVADSDRLSGIAYLAALPVGTALVLEGLRGVLPGRVVTRIGPDALNVERAGPSGELRLQVLFSDLAGLVLQRDSAWWSEWRTKRVLTLVLRDQTVVVQAAELGLRPRDLPWFVGVWRATMEAWLDRFPDAAAGRVAAPGPSAPEKAPSLITTHRPDRYRPSSILSVLGSMFPRPASLAGALLVLGLHPLRIALDRDLYDVPAFLPIGPLPSFAYGLLYTTGRVTGKLAGGLVMATLVVAAFKLMWSAPRFRGLLVLAALSALTAPMQVVGLSFTAPYTIEIVNLCAGTAAPLRFPIEVSVDHDELRYGPFVGRRLRDIYGDPFLFDRVTYFASTLEEVHGLFGGLHLVPIGDYDRICGGWKRRLAEAGR